MANGDAGRAVLVTALQEIAGGRRPFEGDVLLFGERGWFFSHSNRLPFKTVSADYTTDIQDHTVLVDASGAGITVSLPPADGARGRTFTVKKVDSSVNTVTISPNGSETIDGASSHVLTTQNESVIIQSDGSEWWIWNA